MNQPCFLTNHGRFHTIQDLQAPGKQSPNQPTGTGPATGCFPGQGQLLPQGIGGKRHGQGQQVLQQQEQAGLPLPFDPQGHRTQGQGDPALSQASDAGV